MRDTTRPFWIDTDYDRNDDGESRYAEYVRQRIDAFAESWRDHDDGTVWFARTAWYVATSPVMSPGYVRMHPRVLSAQIVRNEWDGSLAADVSLVTGWPRSLASSRNIGGRYWCDWRSEYSFGSERDVFYEPSGEDVIEDSYLMTSARLCFALPSGRLPKPQAAWEALLIGSGVIEDAARGAVEYLIEDLNAIVGPVLARIEGN